MNTSCRYTLKIFTTLAGAGDHHFDGVVVGAIVLSVLMAVFDITSGISH